jgi:DNA repair exonuclease SbcCD ATPase subunit
MINDLLNTLNYRINRTKYFQESIADLQTRNKSLELEVKKFIELRDTVDESALMYKKAVDIIYETSVGDLKNTLNNALQYIFYNKNLEIDICIEDKRGTKTLSFILKDIDSDLEVDLKDGVGNGVRTVLSAIISLFYILNNNSNLLILDEQYSKLSGEYVEKFFTFIKKVCNRREVILIMITHDDRFVPYADRTYYVVDGNVSEVTNG